MDRPEVPILRAGGSRRSALSEGGAMNRSRMRACVPPAGARAAIASSASRAGLDNHRMDCLIGCAVTASMEGAVLFGTDQKAPPRRRLRLPELQRNKREHAF